eukprot:4052185-Karenia_brevis.AAC.1
MEKQKLLKEEGLAQAQIKEDIGIPAVWGFNYMVEHLMTVLTDAEKEEVNCAIENMQNMEKDGKGKVWKVIQKE